MSRFDYVKYDEKAKEDQERFKELFTDVEADVCTRLVSARAKALVFTKLEEAYMWLGKAIRDDQLDRINDE